MQAPSFPESDGHDSSHVDSQLSFDFASAVKIEDDADVTLNEEIEEEEEFSFFCTNPDGSPIAADDVFQDGQIRPVYPIFNRDLLFSDDGTSPSLRPPLKKLFFEDNGGDSASESDEVDAVPAEGSYCEWSKNASPELKNNKSNSTGSSKLWRIRDLVPRSNSDGKDAFVFLNPVSAAARLKESKDAGKSKAVAAVEEKERVKTDKGQKSKLKKGKETVSSAHEKHYVMNRAKKEGEKRRSYLPYRPGVVGFFANVNVLSKNVHPF